MRADGWRPSCRRRWFDAWGSARNRARVRFWRRGVSQPFSTRSDRLEGDHVRGRYFRELFRATPLDPTSLTRALALAGSVIDSDFELSRTLRAAAPVAALDSGSVQAYVDAANDINSDFERRRALVTLLRGRRRRGWGWRSGASIGGAHGFGFRERERASIGIGDARPSIAPTHSCRRSAP